MLAQYFSCLSQMTDFRLLPLRGSLRKKERKKESLSDEQISILAQTEQLTSTGELVALPDDKVLFPAYIIMHMCACVHARSYTSLCNISPWLLASVPQEENILYTT